MSFPPGLGGTRVAPVVQRSFFALWKSFRNDPDQDFDHRQKVTGLKSESVIGIIPES
jgi:hypothetical protein